MEGRDDKRKVRSGLRHIDQRREERGIYELHSRPSEHARKIEAWGIWRGKPHKFRAHLAARPGAALKVVLTLELSSIFGTFFRIEKSVSVPFPF